MTTAVATTSSVLVDMGIIPAPRVESASAGGRIRFKAGRYTVIEWDADAQEQNEVDLGHSFKGVVLPFTVYEKGAKRPRLAAEFYQGWRDESFCRSAVQLIQVEETQTEAQRQIGISGWSRETKHNCLECPLGEYLPDGKWKRLKDTKHLGEDVQPCKWRGELTVIPEGREGAHKLPMSYTGLQQVRGDFRDPRKGVDAKTPTLAAYLEAKPEYAIAFVEGRLICQFDSILVKSDNRKIGDYSVMTVKPIGVTDESMAAPEAVADAAPWDQD